MIYEDVKKDGFELQVYNEGEITAWDPESGDGIGVELSEDDKLDLAVRLIGDVSTKYTDYNAVKAESLAALDEDYLKFRIKRYSEALGIRAKNLKEEEAKKAAEAAEKASADLRSSEIALEALEIYNGDDFTYRTWDEVNNGDGTNDNEVKLYIKQAENRRTTASRNFYARSYTGVDYHSLDTSSKSLVDALILAMELVQAKAKS